MPESAVERRSDELRLLDPRRIRFSRHPESGELRLTILDDRSYLRINAARAFPLSAPHLYVGLFDQDGQEIGMIEDLRELEPSQRTLVEEELEKHYFTPVITAIYKAKSEFGTVYWDVETDRGRRQFVVRSIRESIFEVSPDRYLITDVDGNRFEIRDAARLDRASRARLERLI